MGPKSGSKGKDSDKSAAGSKSKGGSGKADAVGSTKGQKPDASGGKTEKDSKASRKQREAEIERQRRQEVDNMMQMVGGDCDEEEEEELISCIDERAERRRDAEAARMTTDKFGNSISRAAKAEQEKLEVARKEARERREAKAAAAASASAGGDIEDEEEGVEDMTSCLKKTKVTGGKLTRKEKRRLQQGLDSGESGEGTPAPQRSQLDVELDAFSLSVQAGAHNGEGTTLSATDVVVPCFSISAPGRPLLIDASLKLVAGRRYGLLGPNGTSGVLCCAVTG